MKELTPQELQWCTDRFLDYLEKVHGYQNFIASTAQDGQPCVVGGWTDGRIFLLDEDVHRNNPGYALFVAEHIPGHGQDLRRKKMDVPEEVCFDTLKTMREDAREAILTQTSACEIRDTGVGLGMLYHAHELGYFNDPELKYFGDIPLESLHYYSEIYFAHDAIQYENCQRTGDFPHYTVPVIENMDMKKYRLTPSLPVEILPPCVAEKPLILHVQPPDAPPLKLTTAFSHQIVASVQAYRQGLNL